MIESSFLNQLVKSYQKERPLSIESVKELTASLVHYLGAQISYLTSLQGEQLFLALGDKGFRLSDYLNTPSQSYLCFSTRDDGLRYAVQCFKDDDGLERVYLERYEITGEYYSHPWSGQQDPQGPSYIEEDLEGNMRFHPAPVPLDKLTHQLCLAAINGIGDECTYLRRVGKQEYSNTYIFGQATIGWETGSDGYAFPIKREVFNQDFAPSLIRIARVFGTEIGKVIDLNLD